MEDTVQAPPANTDALSGPCPLDRVPSEDNNSTAMTIEFLRARLLSERSVSRAARQWAQQLANKVLELEERLAAEIQRRKKLEADRLEILLKYRTELSEEYGDHFASSFGEGFARDESTPDSPNSRKHDSNDEGFLPYTPNRDEEGLSDHGLGQLDNHDSSQRFNREEPNDEDDETHHSGREKGVLSWGLRKGSRKEFGHGTDWLGRSMLQRSLSSTDGESPHKKWVGKSVRQIRKTESRSYETNFEGENGQAQASEESDNKTGQASDTRERLPCEDERDTEVERVLEQQAEFIGQYEAEENAQRAWEAKYKEAKALSMHGNVISPSISGSKLDAMTCSQSVEEEVMAKDNGTKIVRAENSSPNQSSNDSATKHSRKVHPEDLTRKLEETHERVPPESTATCSCVSRSRGGISEQELTMAENSTELTNTVEVSDKDPSHGQVSANMDTKDSIELSTEATVEPGKRSNYNGQKSSSFRFPVFPDAEPVTDGSPQMHGFTPCKQNGEKVEEFSEMNASTGSAEQIFASDAHSHDLHGHATSTASPDVGIGPNQPTITRDFATARENLESEEMGKDMLQQISGREELLSLTAENGTVDSSLGVGSSNEEMNRRMNGIGSDQDPQTGVARQISDLPSCEEPMGLGGSERLEECSSGFPPSHPDYGWQSRDLHGAAFDITSVYPGPRSGMHGPDSYAKTYDETALRTHRKSVDSFDRVAEVLRALQMAKLQIQSCTEQDVSFPGVRNDYDGREPPRYPPLYGVSPSQYCTVPYSPRAPIPSMHNMHGWGAMPSRYWVGSSSQVAAAPYSNYPLQMLEGQNLWAPPSSYGVHNSNVYHYDMRQHR